MAIICKETACRQLRLQRDNMEHGPRCYGRIAQRLRRPAELAAMNWTAMRTGASGTSRAVRGTAGSTNRGRKAVTRSMALGLLAATQNSRRARADAVPGAPGPAQPARPRRTTGAAPGRWFTRAIM